MDINVVRRYSHLGEKLFCTTYNALGVKLTGTQQVCDGSARSKEKERAVRKKTYTRASHPGERIFVDTTGPFPGSFIGNRYWIGVLDDHIRYSCIFFTKTRSQLTKNMEEFLEKMTPRGTLVKYLCCKKSMEHQSKLHSAFEKEKVVLEYTTPYMPHMNRVMERIFALIKEGALAILLNTKLNDTDQKMLW